ncbi:hypothetical protein SDJN03_30180, partial [Cucurbita argyrosperma subsp. sororia]
MKDNPTLDNRNSAAYFTHMHLQLPATSILILALHELLMTVCFKAKEHLLQRGNYFARRFARNQSCRPRNANQAKAARQRAGRTA